MGLFSGMPKLPPEFMAMLANPAETGRKIKAFVKAAYDLTEAVDAYENHNAEIDTSADEWQDRLETIEMEMKRANAVFKAQLATLPKLDV